MAALAFPPSSASSSGRMDEEELSAGRMDEEELSLLDKDENDDDDNDDDDEADLNPTAAVFPSSRVLVCIVKLLDPIFLPIPSMSRR